MTDFNFLETAASAEQVMSGFPVGSLVSVHYDPADPTTAVLRVGQSNAMVWWLVMATIALAAGVIVIAHTMRRNER